MSDWSTHKDQPVGSLSAKTLEIVLTHPNRSTSEIAKMVGRPSRWVGPVLESLANGGWISPTTHRQIGARGAPWIRRWNATAKAKTETFAPVPYRDTPQQVLAMLEKRGAMTTGELSTALGRPKEGVRSALRTLCRSGAIEAYDGPEGRTYGATEDDGWTPQPWVSSIRARAHPLPTGSR